MSQSFKVYLRCYVKKSVHSGILHYEVVESRLEEQ